MFSERIIISKKPDNFTFCSGLGEKFPVRASFFIETSQKNLEIFLVVSISKYSGDKGTGENFEEQCKCRQKFGLKKPNG